MTDLQIDPTSVPFKQQRKDQNHARAANKASLILRKSRRSKIAAWRRWLKSKPSIWLKYG